MHFTTADVIQRHDNQIYVTVRTSLSDLFAQLQYPQKPTSMLALASSDMTHAHRFREAVLALFKRQFHISINADRIDHLSMRMASSQTLREMFKQEVAEQVLQGHADHASASNDRANFLRMDIDALIPSAKAQRQLNIQFPAELGTISVSYSKPKNQIVKRGPTATRYSQRLD